MSENSDTTAKYLHFPKAETLHRLAISENGFVFDPATGNHFTLNETGLCILRLFVSGKTLQEIFSILQESYDVETREMERDLLEFSSMINEFLGT